MNTQLVSYGLAIFILSIVSQLGAWVLLGASVRLRRAMGPLAKYLPVAALRRFLRQTVWDEEAEYQRNRNAPLAVMRILTPVVASAGLALVIAGILW